MANNVWKFRFTGGTSAAGPKALSSRDSPSGCSINMPDPNDLVDSADLNTEFPMSLKAEITMLFRSELKTALAEDFQNIKSKLQALKTDLANNAATIRSNIETMKTTMSHMEQGLSSCLNDDSSLPTKVGKLETKVTN
ncbi:hypothetical protein CRENBAI_007810 [Crenichthys baileyi]|uniref:Uncharacterized protein n=1 Tax=Crenichthys baileyi TaxID=28760 RepID=A0AAV9R7C1_9TELE